METEVAKAEKLLKYAPISPGDYRYKHSEADKVYYYNGFRYKSYEYYVRSQNFPTWLILMFIDGVAIAYVGFQVLKEYSKVSTFIDEQAKLEAEREQGKQETVEETTEPVKADTEPIKADTEPIKTDTEPIKADTEQSEEKGDQTDEA
jgi:hypothetical protein